MHTNPLVWLNSAIKEFVEGNPQIMEFLQSVEAVVGGMLPWFLVLVAVATIVITLVQRFPQIKGARYYVHLMNPWGKHTNEEVQQRMFLVLALGATVGIGNMAGVSLAIELGGPGALFWMFCFGLLAAALKCASCTLAAKYQERVEGGAVGSPMAYMVKTLGRPGWLIAIMYASALVLAGMFGANAFQVNQASEAIAVVVNNAAESEAALQSLQYLILGVSLIAMGLSLFGVFSTRNAGENGKGQLLRVLYLSLTVLFMGAAGWSLTDSATQFLSRPDAPITVKTGFGVLLCISAAFVLFRGVEQIKKASNIVVPIMGFMYVAACLWVNGANFGHIGETLQTIVVGAFNPAAFGWGSGMGIVSVATMGILRALFSSEAGLGSAAFAQSSVPTKEPVRAGLSAMPATFIDTNVICMITGLTIVSSGVYKGVVGSGELLGIKLVLRALETELGIFAGIFLAVAAMMFAFSTVIAWSYYGDVASRDLIQRLRHPFSTNGDHVDVHADLNKSTTVRIHRVIYTLVVLIAALVELQTFMPVMDFAFVSLFIINTLVLLFNARHLSRIFSDYWKREKDGALLTTEKG